jgi:peptide chain release factor 1
MGWPESVSRKDLKITRTKSRGPGGQHVNKSNSAIHMTHLPTGISAQSQDSRSQVQNLKIAFRRLAEKLIPLMKQETARKRYNAPEERIRTYNKPDQRVTDHRLGGRKWGYDEVIYKDGLADIIETLLSEGVGKGDE